MEGEALRLILAAIQENTTELRAIRQLLEAQNREGLMMPTPTEAPESNEAEAWNQEVERLFRGELDS